MKYFFGILCSIGMIWVLGMLYAKTGGTGFLALLISFSFMFVTAAAGLIAKYVSERSK